jgi:hypothetical protein
MTHYCVQCSMSTAGSIFNKIFATSRNERLNPMCTILQNSIEVSQRANF